MTQPEAPPPPTTIGTQPKSADEINMQTGTHLRGFIASKATISNDQDFFAATDLTAAPYYFTADQETQLKTAISQLDQALDAIDMTFINRIVGMW
jgi:hypothetical protein